MKQTHGNEAQSNESMSSSSQIRYVAVGGEEGFGVAAERRAAAALATAAAVLRPLKAPPLLGATASPSSFTVGDRAPAHTIKEQHMKKQFLIY